MKPVTTKMSADNIFVFNNAGGKFFQAASQLSLGKVGWDIINLQLLCLSMMDDFNCNSLFKI